MNEIEKGNIYSKTLVFTYARHLLHDPRSTFERRDAESKKVCAACSND